MKKITLYTPATMNGAWFLVTIDCALWLSRKRNVNEIQVISYPINKYLNPFRFFLKIKNFQHYVKKLWKNQSAPYAIENSIIGNQSDLHKFVTSESGGFSINHKDVVIRFINKGLRFNKISLFELFSNIASTFSINLGYFTTNKLRQNRHLDFKINNYNAGLHILSEALRSDYKSYGSIFESKIGILTAIYKLVISIKIIKSISIDRNEEVYVFGPDQEYIYGAFSQLLCRRGAKFIETESMQEPFVIQEGSEKYYKRPTIKAYPCEHDKNSLKSLIENYFHDRVTAPWKVYPDIDFLKGVQQKPIASITEPSSNLTVVIYLHSFTDAQYVYGHDGYYDLEDWTVSTVKALYSNSNVSKIILKPHPGIDPVYHPGDVIANRRLRKRLYYFKDKMTWADFHFNTQQLKKIGKCLAITHHGSVAEEASYLGIPLIASVYGPWGSEYVFGYFWHNKEEYEELLRTLDDVTLDISADNRNSLFNYVKDKDFSKIKTHGFDTSSIWLAFLKHFNVPKHHEFDVNMEVIKDILVNISSEDKRFANYLNDRSGKINLICDYKMDVTR